MNTPDAVQQKPIVTRASGRSLYISEPMYQTARQMAEQEGALSGRRVGVGVIVERALREFFSLRGIHIVPITESNGHVRRGTEQTS